MTACPLFYRAAFVVTPNRAVGRSACCGMKGFTAVAAENSSFQQIIDIGDMLAVFIGKVFFEAMLEEIQTIDKKEKPTD